MAIVLQPPVFHMTNWINSEDATRFFIGICQEIDPQQGQVKVYGKVYDEPRLTSWHTTNGGTYKYSGKINQSKPFTPILDEIRRQIIDRYNVDYNSVLVNVYRNGDDYVSWHSDSEKEIEGSIFSLSFGTPRRFLVRSKADHSQKWEYQLGHGDLLLMHGDCQSRFEHHVPKQKNVGLRINLTFRRLKV